MKFTAFETFYRDSEVPLRRALVARYGFELGREAAAEALAWGYEHWERLSTMDNPRGYLYRVGCTKAERQPKPARFPVPAHQSPDGPFEPSLSEALESLTDKQRLAVVLVVGCGFTYQETADLTDLSISTIRTHLQRGLDKLRDRLGVAP